MICKTFHIVAVIPAIFDYKFDDSELTGSAANGFAFTLSQNFANKFGADIRM